MASRVGVGVPESEAVGRGQSSPRQAWTVVYTRTYETTVHAPTWFRAVELAELLTGLDRSQLTVTEACAENCPYEPIPALTEGIHGNSVRAKAVTRTINPRHSMAGSQVASTIAGAWGRLRTADNCPTTRKR